MNSYRMLENVFLRRFLAQNRFLFVFVFVFRGNEEGNDCSAGDHGVMADIKERPEMCKSIHRCHIRGPYLHEDIV